MRIHALQMVDRYAGIPLCGVFSLFPRRPRDVRPEGIRSILVIKMLGMGSIVVMTPMFRSLRRRFPAARIDFLTMRGHAPLSKLYGFADTTHTVDFGSCGRFVRGNLKSLAAIRKLRYDLVIDAEFYSRYTALFSYLCRPGTIAGFHSRDIYRGRLREVRVYFNHYRHMAQNFLELARRVGAPEESAAPTRPELVPAAAARVREELAAAGIDPERPYVLLNPHASNVACNIDRRWPLPYFKQVGDFLQEKGYPAVVVDAPGQGAYTESLIRMSGGVIRRLPREKDLPGLLELIRGAFLLITNDTGPLHLAVSAGTPTFSFFGTETPVLYGYNAFPHTVFFEGLACSPCLSVLNFKRGRCDLGVRCLAEITPAKVFKSFSDQEPALREYWVKRKNEIA